MKSGDELINGEPPACDGSLGRDGWDGWEPALGRDGGEKSLVDPAQQEILRLREQVAELAAQVRLLRKIIMYLGKQIRAD